MPCSSGESPTGRPARCTDAGTEPSYPMTAQDDAAFASMQSSGTAVTTTAARESRIEVP